MTLRPLVLAMAGATWLLAGQAAIAAMGGSSSNYGILPSDIATAQAMSIFSHNTSATFYNPAALAQGNRGEVTGGIYHADHDLQADGRRVVDDPSQQLVLGLKTNLTQLSSLDHPLYFGFLFGTEKFSKEMMAFRSATEDHGQFLYGGRNPLFIAAGGGTTLWRGIDVGLSLRISLHSDATLNTRSTLGGETSQEELDVSAKPFIRPILGTTLRWGETFCKKSDCWLNNLETAISYRAYTYARTKVTSNVIVPGVIPGPGLHLSLATIDAFQPETTTVGIRYTFSDDLRVAFTGEYQAWSRLDSILRNDTVRDQAHLNFQDIFIPRLGIEYDWGPYVTLRGGIAHEESPLEGRRSLDLNYLDADKTIVGLGMSLHIPKLPVIGWPVDMDLGYQHQKLEKRKFDLTSTNPAMPPSPYGTVETKGEVNVFTASITLKM